jgi:hypothetical protein
VFDGSISSTSVSAVSMLATGKLMASSKPICVRTLAWAS